MIFIIFLLCYLIGSFPSAYFLSTVIARKNILTLGDKNGGARNVYHSVGKKIGLLTFLFDFSKGFLIFFIGTKYHLIDTLLFLALFFAWLGHCYPIWLRGKGGKGVALIIGFLLPQHFFIAVLSAIFFFFMKRIVKNFDIAYTLTVMFFLALLVMGRVTKQHFLLTTMMFFLPLVKFIYQRIIQRNHSI